MTSVIWLLISSLAIQIIRLVQGDLLRKELKKRDNKIMSDLDTLNQTLNSALSTLADVKDSIEIVIAKIQSQDLSGALAEAQQLADGLAAIDTEVKGAE